MGKEPAPAPLDVEADEGVALAAIPVYGRIEAEGVGAAEGMLAAIVALLSDPNRDAAGGVAAELAARATSAEAAGGVAVAGPLDAPRGNGPMKSGG